MRTIDNLIESFREGLKSISSPLSNFVRYSNTYAIARAFSYPLLLKEIDFDQMQSSMFISSAENDYLDLRGKEYGLFRRQGTKAEGFVLVTGSFREVPRGTVLSTVDGSLQYFINSNLLSFNNSIRISSQGVGPQYNIKAGTRLYSSLYPNLTFNVGNSVNGNTTFLGDLAGGTSPESDFAFKRRIIANLKGRHKGTLTSISSAISDITSNNRFFVFDSNPHPGIFTVYIDTKDLQILSDLEIAISVIKPIGSIFRLFSIEYQSVTIDASITICPSCDIDDTIVFIKNNINNYLSSVFLGDEVDVIGLATAISNTEGVEKSTLNFPRSSITLDSNSLPIADNINLTITQ